MYTYLSMCVAVHICSACLQQHTLCVTVCYCVLQYMLYTRHKLDIIAASRAACGSVLRHVAVCCGVLRCDAVCRDVWQCVVVYLHIAYALKIIVASQAACCSVMQCVAVCCSTHMHQVRI